jgi:ABC-type lipoprotein release transport system permease subunit
LIASLLFEVRPMDVTVLAGACLVLAIVSGVAAFVPARRATSIDPRESLS